MIKRRRLNTGIYIIRNMVNGKVYVGSAKRLKNRWSVHRATLNKGTHHCQKLLRAWVKYGAEAFVFEIIEYCTLQNLLAREQYWLDKMNAVKVGYNIQPVAGSGLGLKHSDVVRASISEHQKTIGADPEERRRRSERAKKQHAAGNFGRITWTEESEVAFSKNISRALKGHVVDEKARSNMSVSGKKRYAKLSNEEKSARASRQSQAHWDNASYQERYRILNTRKEAWARLSVSERKLIMHSQLGAYYNRGSVKAGEGRPRSTYRPETAY